MVVGRKNARYSNTEESDPQVSFSLHVACAHSALSSNVQHRCQVANALVEDAMSDAASCRDQILQFPSSSG